MINIKIAFNPYLGFCAEVPNKHIGQRRAQCYTQRTKHYWRLGMLKRAMIKEGIEVPSYFDSLSQIIKNAIWTAIKDDYNQIVWVDNDGDISYIREYNQQIPINMSMLFVVRTEWRGGLLSALLT